MAGDAPRHLTVSASTKDCTPDCWTERGHTLRRPGCAVRGSVLAPRPPRDLIGWCLDHPVLVILAAAGSGALISLLINGAVTR